MAATELCESHWEFRVAARRSAVVVAVSGAADRFQRKVVGNGVELFELLSVPRFLPEPVSPQLGTLHLGVAESSDRRADRLLQLVQDDKTSWVPENLARSELGDVK